MAPNLFAYIALGVWPLVCLWLFATRPLVEAILWTLLGAQLLLPVGAAVKLEMIPQFDKNSISNICAVLGCIVVARGTPKFFQKIGLIEILICAYIATPFITSSFNADPIFIGNRTLPGVGNYDAFSAALAQTIHFFPFVLGRRFLRSANANYSILHALTVAGVLYSFPLLFEVRFSPQLQAWIYGFSPAEFLQSIRGGGYRPMVFLGHGLIAAFFVMTTVVAGCALTRVRARVLGFPAVWSTIYLSGLLVLCKSLGAFVYGLFLGPLVRFGSAKLQFRVAVILVTIALSYPILRASELFPTTSLVELSGQISEARAASLQFRFKNEDQLLQHANERFWFGWGRYGRNRVYDEDGKDTNVTDGRWIITLGQFGFIGFLVEFALLTMPVFMAARAYKFAATGRERVLLGALTLIVAIGAIELLPNSTLSPWSWFLCGALLGRAESLRVPARRKVQSQYPEGVLTSTSPPAP